MQSDWAPPHCDALRKLLASSLSYSEIAAALNAIFQTTYSRSATIGRAKRMGPCRHATRRAAGTIVGGAAAKPERVARTAWGRAQAACTDP